LQTVIAENQNLRELLGISLMGEKEIENIENELNEIEFFQKVDSSAKKNSEKELNSGNKQNEISKKEIEK